MTVDTTQLVELGPADPVPGHSFASADHVSVDRAVLCLLIRDFHDHVTTAPGDEPVVRHVPSPDDWYRRVVVPRPAATWDHPTLTVVGFFGRVRDVVDPHVEAAIKEASDHLAEAVLTAPGVLGYTTHLLSDERNYANLVLLEDRAAIEKWRTNESHRDAARDLAPEYYSHVRIYTGSVPSRRLSREGAVRLDRVKYWDYRTTPVWHGMRRLR